MTVLFDITIAVFVFIACFLILLILIQKGRGGGLTGAFGGAGGQTAFGSKTGDVLTWATSIVFGVFLLLAIGLNFEANAIDAARHRGVVPVAPAAPPPGPANSTAPAS